VEEGGSDRLKGGQKAIELPLWLGAYWASRTALSNLVRRI